MIDTDQWNEFSKLMNFSGLSKILKCSDHKLFLLLLKKIKINQQLFACGLLNIMFFAVYAVTYFYICLFHVYLY